MRLKHIKLSGFKSFVDPTTIPMPSNRVAVVGPNGCGKSNVIDAVRWVMGESSAKQLRGESMADVIFNGSSQRKPVGLASVELEFDNADGALGGEYAKYAEISIRRQVNREGDSQYFLNGTRCRRRDITDIFLGTGLGPRSYAVIEQGMISRFIEAKPDEMRIYLEEVAGISKYKERRHETELKLRSTQENLNRLNDINLELTSQLEHLQNQAHAAEKYKQLKHTERNLKAQLYVTRWKLIKQQMKIQEETIETLKQKLQSALEQQHQLEETLEQHREGLHDAHETLQTAHQQHYTLGATLTQLQQALHHAKERKAQLMRDLTQTEQDMAYHQTQLAQEKQTLVSLADEINQLKPQVDNTQQLVTDANSAQVNAELTLQAWQARWDEYQHAKANATSRLKLEQTKLAHAEQRLHTSNTLATRLTQEYDQIDLTGLQQEILQLEKNLADLNAQCETSQLELDNIQHQITHHRQTREDLSAQLDKLRREIQRLHGKRASLDALQQEALGLNEKRLNQWLTQHQLNQFPKLIQTFQVEKGWEKAVETVLGDFLQAICLEEFSSLNQLLLKLPQTNLGFIDARHPASTSTLGLASKIKSQVSLDYWLNGIYVTDTLEAALAQLPQLKSHESVITRDGIWLGAHWARVLNAQASSRGVLARKSEIETLDAELLEFQTQEQSIQHSLAYANGKLTELEASRTALQKQAQQQMTERAQVATELKLKQERTIQLQRRHAQIQQELGEQTELQRDVAQQIEQSTISLSQTETQLTAEQEQETLLQQEREQHRQLLEQTKKEANQYQTSAHHLSLRLQSCLTQQQLKTQTLEKTTQQLILLRGRIENLKTELSNAEMPIASITSDMLQHSQKQPELEEALTRAREQVEHIEHTLKHDEQQRVQHDNNIQGIRDELSQLQIDIQSHIVRCATLEEQLAETHITLDAVLAELREPSDPDALDSQLNKVIRQIERLGPINLAAIDELNEQGQRKTEIDRQMADLNEALAMLNDAIAKIDRETKATFKETFDQINQLFGENFPRLFGGGIARMELTSEDLLSAGIAILAQPPGKRISHIHLLSGGEKALTAVALVFALFHLNPAPFCMLDEVDAPLDDANVNRFCNLVKEMSEKVQFIFISHNKIAIEMGEQLIGVTMHEPGVSRLVAVDIKQAMEMVEE